MILDVQKTEISAVNFKIKLQRYYFRKIVEWYIQRVVSEQLESVEKFGWVIQQNYRLFILKIWTGSVRSNLVKTTILQIVFTIVGLFNSHSYVSSILMMGLILLGIF